MNEQESVDVESAYGSEISTNSETLMKRDTFTIEKSTSRNQIHWKWLKHKLRDYMVLETVFFLILVFLLVTCYGISQTILNIQSQLNSFQEPTGNDFMKQIITQNQETQRMIMIIQSQLHSLQSPTGRDVSNMKTETEKVNENESEKTREMLEEVLKEVRMKPEAQLEQSQSIINTTTNPEETYVPPLIPTVSTNSTLKRVNEASFLAGATIDTSLSSSSSLSKSSFFGFDQSDLVLVDRPEPPANKAWCTSDKNPILIVNLAKYINLTAVSYQHSKWNETIPDDAPKEYSVEACFDNNCMTRKLLFSHCEYNQHGLQEQRCNNISNDSISSPVKKLQFRFHKNHGNNERTCVSLVRVYSDTELVPEQKFRGLEDTTTCLEVNHLYHHDPNTYKYHTFKNCALLYSKGCCQECPECCEECDIKDYNPKTTESFTIFVFLLSLFAFSFLVICFGIYMQLTHPNFNVGSYPSGQSTYLF